MATLISGGRRSEGSSWFDVTTERGVTFGVGLMDCGIASVYLQHSSPYRLCLGKHFHADTPATALTKALAHHKTAAMRAALSALLTHITEQQAAA